MIAGETIAIALPSAHGEPRCVTYAYANSDTTTKISAAHERRSTIPSAPIANAPATTPASRRVSVHAPVGNRR